MNSLPNIPLTIVSPTNVNAPSFITIGLQKDSNYLSVPVPNAKQEQYWMVIFERQTLKVAENFMFSDNTSVPTQVSSYLNNSDYFYVFTTQIMASNRVPTSHLYDWLISEGAGVGLKTIEQEFYALNCAAYRLFSYTFVNIFGPKVSSSLEFYNFENNRLVTALQLMPIQIGGTTSYMPIKIR
ncbi:hypothetical protein [Psychroserpens sp. MEBiC05023]